jgi:hypothetical protein
MALESPYTLNNVRSLTNYGLYIIGSTVDPIWSKGILNSKPNILINGSTCTIDYSHVYDISDKVYLNKTFGGVTGGETFYVSSSNYYDENKNILSTLSATCRLSQKLNSNQIVIATIISGFTATSNYNYYSKENFVDTPQYTFTSTGGTVGNFLINSLPNSSPTTFKEMGLLGSLFDFEEYVDISGGTAQNKDKLKIYGTTTLKDNTEILYFTSGATAQDFSTTATTVNAYLRGYPSLITAPYNSNVTGIFTISNALTGALLSCFENQSINQTSLRKSKLATAYIGSYINCESCYDLIYGSGLGTPINVVSPAFSNLLYLTIASPSSATATNAVNGFILATAATGSVNLTTTTNTILKIDLSHPSIMGYNLSIFVDAGYKIPIGTNYNSYGIPGYNGAYAIVQNYQTSTTLYCTLTGRSNLYLTIKT